MRERLKALLEERSKTWNDAQALNDKVVEEKRDMTAEEEARWQALNTDLDEFDGKVQELTKQIRSQDAADEARALAEKTARPNPKKDEEREESEEEKALREFFKGERRSVVFTYGDADVRELHGGYEARTAARERRERRDLTVGTAAAGGNTVPISFVRRLYEHLIEVSSIRQTNVSVITTASGEELRVPKTTAHGAAAAIVAEGIAFAEADPTFGQVVLNAFKYGKLLQLSSELVEDTAVDLLGYVARDMGRAIARGTTAHYVTGDGSSKPNGVVTASTLGKTAASATAITADELIDLFYSVIRPYRGQGSWMMKDSTIALVRKLKDTTNQYLWQPGLVGGEPDRILGRPLFDDPEMPAAASAQKSVLFGDLSTYTIRDVGAVELRRSDDFAFDKDLITYRVRFRTDGDLIDTSGAVKHLIQAV